MLALREIAKSYARLEGISLDVAVGEVVLLAGKNGAGNTTLLRIATGYLDPDAGEVTIVNGDLDGCAARAAAAGEARISPGARAVARGADAARASDAAR